MDLQAPFVAVEPQARHVQRGTGVAGELGCADGHDGLFAEEVHFGSAPAEIAFAYQRDDAAGFELGAQARHRRLSPGQRQDLEAQAFPELHEGVVKLLGAQALGHRGEATEAARGPHPRHVPIAGVGHQQDDAVTGGGGFLEQVTAADHALDALRQLGAGDRGQTECLHPVPQVTAHRGLDQCVRDVLRCQARHAREVAAQLRRAAAICGEAVGRLLRGPQHGPFGKLAHDLPPGQVPQRCEVLSGPGEPHAVSPAG